MNEEEVRKQLEALAEEYFKGRVFSGPLPVWMAGAQAAWELATNPSEDDEQDYKLYSCDLILPGETYYIAHKAFLAGRRGLRGAVQAAEIRVANDALKSMEAMVTAGPVDRQMIGNVFYKKYFNPPSGGGA